MPPKKRTGASTSAKAAAAEEPKRVTRASSRSKASMSNNDESDEEKKQSEDDDDVEIVLPPQKSKKNTSFKKKEENIVEKNEKNVKPENNDDDGDDDDDDDDQNSPKFLVKQYQNVIIKSFESMINDESTIPSQLRRIARIYFNSSEEEYQVVAIQFLEAIYRISTQLFLVDPKSQSFQTYSRLLPRVWKTICADMFIHCKLVQGWTEEQFKERIVFLQERATTGLFSLLSRELSTGPKTSKLLSLELLHKFGHDLDEQFEISVKDSLMITTAFIPRLLDTNYEIRKLALHYCSPFLLSKNMFDAVRYLAVTDQNEDIRRYALWLLYRPAFTEQYKDEPQLATIDALLIIARMQDESPAIRSTLLQLFEEKELRISAISNDIEQTEFKENDVKFVNNSNIYKTYGHLFRCDYQNRRSSSKLNYRQKLWVIKQGLSDPDKRIVWQTMNMLTKLFCCENFDLVDFLYYLGCGQSTPPPINPDSITDIQRDLMKTVNDAVLLADNAAYQYNDRNNNKIWTSTIASLTTSLNRPGMGNNANSSGIDPTVFTMGSADGAGQGVSNNSTNDPIQLFLSSGSSLGNVLNSSIYQDLCLIISYIVCSYSWRHEINLGDGRIEYHVYKRRRLVPNYGPRAALDLGKGSSHVGGDGGDDNLVEDFDDDDELMEGLMGEKGKKIEKRDDTGGKKKRGMRHDNNEKENDNNNNNNNNNNPSTFTPIFNTNKKNQEISNDSIANFIPLDQIKLNTRQVVLELPPFQKMLRHTIFHFQASLYQSQLQHYNVAIQEWNQFIELRQSGDEEALAIEATEPVPPVEPTYASVVFNDGGLGDDDEVHDINTPILTSGLCLLWYFLLSSLSGQKSTNYISILESYQKQYQQRQGIRANMEKNEQKSAQLLKMKSLPVVDFQQLSSSQPQLSCPGFSSPKITVDLTDTQYFTEIRPDISSSISLLPLLDQFGQPSLTLHMLLLIYHVDMKETQYNNLLTFYNHFESFISAPEFHNSFLPLVFLFIRTSQPIVMIRYYQHNDWVNMNRTEFELQYQQSQLKHLQQTYQSRYNIDPISITDNDLDQLPAPLPKLSDIDIDGVDFDDNVDCQLPTQPRTYIQIMTELVGSFMDTIMLTEYTPTDPSYQLTNHFTKHVEIPTAPKMKKNAKKTHHSASPVDENRDPNNPSLYSQDNMDGIDGDNDEDDGIAKDDVENGQYTPHSLRQKYRLQMLLLQTFYNEFRHNKIKTNNDNTSDFNDPNTLKRVKRMALVKRECNEYRKHYYSHVGQVEFLLKRLLILILDLFQNCPVISQPKLPTGLQNPGKNATGIDLDLVRSYKEQVDVFFSINICCTEDVIHYLLHSILYPILGWKRYLLTQEVESLDDNGEIVLVPHSRLLWFELDFYSVDLNFLLINILTQSALLSTSPQHVTIVLQFLLLFTTVTVQTNPNMNITGIDNDNLYNFKPFNTNICQTIDYSPQNNGSLDVLNSQGFFSTRKDICDPQLNPELNKDTDLIDNNGFLDITRVNGYSHMFIHPILQLQAIKSISDILCSFANLVPITSHQHSYDLLSNDAKDIYQPRTIGININSNDSIPSVLIAEQAAKSVIGVPVDVVMQCHQVLLGYAQSYINNNNEISSNYLDFVQQHPMLEIEQIIGNIYRSLTKFHYKSEHHSELAEKIKNGKIAKKNVGKKNQKFAQNFNEVFSDDDENTGKSGKRGKSGKNDDNDNNNNNNNNIDSDDLLEFSDYEFEDELLKLQLDNAEDDSTLSKRIIKYAKQTKDYNRKNKHDIRDAYKFSQEKTYEKMLKLSTSIHKLVQFNPQPDDQTSNSPTLLTTSMTSSLEIANVNSIADVRYNTNAIFTGDLFCISDLSYDLQSSLNHGPTDKFSQVSLDGLIFPLKDMVNVFRDEETSKRISDIFSQLGESQPRLKNSDNIDQNTTIGISSKHQGSKHSHTSIISQETFDMFLHDDLFLLFKSIQNNQLSQNSSQYHTTLSSNPTTHKLQERAIKRATPFEPISYAHFDDPFLILRGIEDKLVSNNFFHSLSPAAQLQQDYNQSGDASHGAKMLLLHNHNATMRDHRHLNYQKASKWNRKQAYNIMYQVSMNTNHLDLYTNTYISVIYQSMQNIAIFALCKLLFFNRVPYILTQQYLSVLIISTILSQSKKKSTQNSNSTASIATSNTNNPGFTSTSVISSSIQQQDLYELLQLFFQCYIKLNFNHINLITSTNQHYIYTLHLYQNIAKKIAYKRWLQAEPSEAAKRKEISIDQIVFGFKNYDSTIIKNQQNLSKDTENDVTLIPFNYYGPDMIAVKDLPTLSHIKDNLELRKFLWSSLSSQDQFHYKQLYHSAHSASDWCLSTGVSVCDHLTLLSTTSPSIIFDIVSQFNKTQSLSLIPLFIDFTALLLSPSALSHSNSSFNPLFLRGENLPVDFSNTLPHHQENVNSAVQHGLYGPLSTSISPLAKFGIDLLTVILRTPMFKDNFASLMAIIKVIVSSISEWQILPRDFYPIFHQHSSDILQRGISYPDDITGRELYPENPIVAIKSGQNENDQKFLLTSEQPLSQRLNGKALLEHTLPSPSRRAVIGFYLFFVHVIDLYRFIQAHEIVLPGELSNSKQSISKQNKDQNIAEKKRLVTFYDNLVNDVKDLLSKLIYFISFTRANSSNAPVDAVKLTKGKKGAKKGAKKAPVKKAAKPVKRRTTKRVKSEDGEGSDDSDNDADDNDVDVDDNDNDDDNNDDNDHDDEQDHPQSQLINYQDPLVKILNKKTVTMTATSSLSNTMKNSFNSPYIYDVFYLYQLINDYDKDSSYTIDALLENGLNLEKLTTFQLDEKNSSKSKKTEKKTENVKLNTLAGGSDIIVDNDIEDYITTIMDQRARVVSNASSNISKSIWKRHFMKLEFLEGLIIKNEKNNEKNIKKQNIGVSDEESDGGFDDENSNVEISSSSRRPSSQNKGKYVKRTGMTPKRGTKTPRKQLKTVIGSDDDDDDDDTGTEQAFEL